MLALDGILRKVLANPGIHIKDASLNSADKEKDYPYTDAQITRMKAFFLKHNWIGYWMIFCKDDDGVNRWQSAWPSKYASRKLFDPGSVKWKLLVPPENFRSN